VSDTRQDFADQLLRDLGDPITRNDEKSIEDWTYEEQSNNAAWNADKLNALGVERNGKVTPFSSFNAGVQGTANTLENGLYDNVLADLKNNASPATTGNDIVNSPWSGNYYRSRGLKAFLAGGKTSTSSSPGIWDQIVSGIAGGAASGVGSVASNPAFSLSNPLAPLFVAGGAAGGGAAGGAKSAGGAVALGVEQFAAKFSLVVLGLAVLGVGIYKIVSPKAEAVAPTIAKAAA
jgi:hypothetical protein